MKSRIPSFARDLVALVVAFVACPVSVFGGANLGCVGQAKFEGSCASTMVFISPLVLLAAGAVAGIATRGWTGLFATLVGVVGGMFAFLGISNLAGRPVPPDIFTGVVATVWFMGPVIIGYAIGRVLTRLVANRSG
ncbi:MAG TPA: hypothetical protein VIR16_08610 [Candidatus Limnocylindrales bacterium]